MPRYEVSIEEVHLIRDEIEANDSEKAGEIFREMVEYGDLDYDCDFRNQTIKEITI